MEGDFILVLLLEWRFFVPLTVETEAEEEMEVSV